MNKKGITLYNIIFPIWLLLWFPSWLWLIIIPLNYLVDRAVFTILAKKAKPELNTQFFRQNTWKLFLRGFGADFIGTLFLLIPTLFDIIFDFSNKSFLDFNQALSYAPFSNPLALIYTIIAIAFAGFLIYKFDKKALLKMGVFGEAEAKKIALLLAIITAPYLYLLPGSLFY